jgi:hypothetical protein
MTRRLCGRVLLIIMILILQIIENDGYIIWPSLHILQKRSPTQWSKKNISKFLAISFFFKAYSSYDRNYYICISKQNHAPLKHLRSSASQLGEP